MCNFNRSPNNIFSQLFFQKSNFIKNLFYISYAMPHIKIYSLSHTIMFFMLNLYINIIKITKCARKENNEIAIHISRYYIYISMHGCVYHSYGYITKILRKRFIRIFTSYICTHTFIYVFYILYMCINVAMQTCVCWGSERKKTDPTAYVFVVHWFGYNRQMIPMFCMGVCGVHICVCMLNCITCSVYECVCFRMLDAWVTAHLNRGLVY